MLDRMFTSDVGYTVKESKDMPVLPDGSWRFADDVKEEIKSVLQAAMDKWYAEGGNKLVEDKPEVY